jgi:putative ABC transport system permease protein
MALGARQADIFNATVADGLKLAAIGVVAGVVMAYGAGRLLESLLAGVQPADLGTLSAAVVIALVMTLAGSALPAVRAVRVDPTVAMRAE